MLQCRCSGKRNSIFTAGAVARRLLCLTSHCGRGIRGSRCAVLPVQGGITFAPPATAATYVRLEYICMRTLAPAHPVRVASGCSASPGRVGPARAISHAIMIADQMDCPTQTGDGCQRLRGLVSGPWRLRTHTGYIVCSVYCVCTWPQYTQPLGRS
ncbi:hypothetical protein BDU57DRAFT_2777 [Ampelomyces quisqualis]|uniref:Uncharacterized protein n=1 Tax=Ampelomyces quisqualis TaxID=50730 RepID=A0A6A5QXC9_AMPQU|nr:hypothetical protein BDU57DRAFT_2777 [Ampelomyces quisqualis]